jgi:hypothetical protein
LPSKIPDEYVHECGSNNPAAKVHGYFLLRAYTIDGVGHCAPQLSMNRRRIPPCEGSCEVSIATEAAAINRLGGLFERFARLEHLELRWTPMTAELDGILIPYNQRSKCVHQRSKCVHAFAGSKLRCLPPCAISEVMPDKHA